jgi:Helix-turn-helix domain
MAETNQSGAMSIEYLTAVWKDEYYTEKDKTKLLVALAIADCADGNGYAFPGVEYLAKKSRCGTRSVQELCRELEKDGKLEIQAGKGRNGTNLYRVLGVQPLRGSKDSVSVQGVQPLQGATVAGCKVAPDEAALKAAAEAPLGCTQTVRNHQEPSITVSESATPDLETFCEYFSTRIICLGFPVPLDNWLMEKHGYLASQVWPKTPPLKWKALEGKLISDYRSWHAQQQTKTLPMRNGKPQKPINDF